VSWIPLRKEWRPASRATEITYDPPPVGSIIAHELRALEVLAYDQRDDGRTTVHIRRIYGPKIKAENDHAECGLTYRGRVMWHVYINGRVPLCSCCGDPWPCSRVMDERQARVDLSHMADQIAKAGDGQCYSCGEPITRRQSSATATEPNLELPGFPPPQFHLRRSCRGGLSRYEAVRRAALKGSWSPLLATSDELPLNEGA